jgi:hypothetical protein
MSASGRAFCSRTRGQCVPKPCRASANATSLSVTPRPMALRPPAPLGLPCALSARA